MPLDGRLGSVARLAVNVLMPNRAVEAKGLGGRFSPFLLSLLACDSFLGRYFAPASAPTASFRNGTKAAAALWFPSRLGWLS